MSFLEGLSWDFFWRFWRSSVEELALRRFRFFLSVEELVLLRWCFFFLFFVWAFFSLELSPEPEGLATLPFPAPVEHVLVGGRCAVGQAVQALASRFSAFRRFRRQHRHQRILAAS